MEFEKQYDAGASLMILANFIAKSESTGFEYTGFSICSAEWCYQASEYMPCYEDMIEHFYRNPQTYGYEIGPLEITKIRFEIIEPKDNLLMNMN